MPFPAIALLDSFIRGDEHPLSDGGQWTAFPCPDARAGGGPGEAPQVKNNRCTSVFGWGEGEYSAYWNPSVFADIAAAFRQEPQFPWLVGGGGEEPGEKARLYVRLKKVTATEFTGYFLQLEKDTETEGKWKITLRKFVAPSVASTVLREVTLASGVANGDLWGITAIGTILQMWHKKGAGAWEELAEPVTDASFAEGWTGVGVRGTATRAGVQDFEAGQAETKEEKEAKEKAAKEKAEEEEQHKPNNTPVTKFQPDAPGVRLLLPPTRVRIGR
jgi:hypothetical protein